MMTVVSTPPPYLTANQALVAAQLIMLWALGTYCFQGNDLGVSAPPPAREAERAHRPLRYAFGRVLGILVATWYVLPQVTPIRFLLLVVPSVAAGGLPVMRLWLKHRQQRDHWRAYGAELELLVVGIVCLCAVWLAKDTGGSPRLLLAFPDLPVNRLAICCAALAVVPFCTRGGTYIVRGVLEKSGAAPKQSTPTMSGMEGTLASAEILPPADTQTDLTEYNRGRVIGAIERIIVATAVAAGNYEVLAFLAAAKGFIRGKALERRDFSEYFLIGNLASSLVALLVGLCVQRMLTFW